MKIISVDYRRLRKIIRKDLDRCLILDCRPYLPFSTSSIKGSINVNLNTVIIRRSKGGPVPLQFVIPDERARSRLREGSISAVVVLDERTPHWQKLKKDSNAQIVINTLFSLTVTAGPKICFLKGGYESFSLQYPEFCSGLEPNPQEGSGTDKSHSNPSEKLNTSLKPAYDQGSPVEILPYLYLGSASHASNWDLLADLSITALLNVSHRSTECLKGQLYYKWIPVEDSHTADISSHFQEAIDFIECVRRAGRKVLVHCEAGISRSPTICMAYLMKTRRFRLEEAFDYTKQRRSFVSPNFGFMGQLLQYESEILPSTPSTPVPTCKRETAFFFAEELALKSWPQHQYLCKSNV
ncbi:dual specificity protein phosphatase 5 [Latimeria chalumnae]|uniref:Dual specificity protein phosphatase n=1 Tax=Latimeria chalumnae TaxID=7897 RepID=M3XIE3_LATCH|nr:PREDICTED: dual specificity protein phosphatase 5 [Latimeria chalumnae]|eukprot:XP_005998854.1 PREDICTED: dual specificity protein phosphatase 5 [Latimeria chalumnae]